MGVCPIHDEMTISGRNYTEKLGEIVFVLAYKEGCALGVSVGISTQVAWGKRRRMGYHFAGGLGKGVLEEDEISLSQEIRGRENDKRYPYKGLVERSFCIG